MYTKHIMKLEYKIKDNKYTNIKQILKEEFHISDRLIIKLKKNNHIYINNNSVPINEDFKVNDLLTIDLDFTEESKNIISTKMNLDILYEDDGLLIINKSSNIPVHPSMMHFENSLSNGVKYYFETNNIKRKIRPVNRLDKNTSGIVIFAKNEYIQECLSKQMKLGLFNKEYIAVLEGNLKNNSGTINAPICRKENSIIERKVSEKGAISITHYELIKNYNDLDKKRIEIIDKISIQELLNLIKDNIPNMMNFNHPPELCLDLIAKLIDEYKILLFYK